MWNVYVLKSHTSQKLYVGITQDLNRRIFEHNSGKSKFTSGYVPWTLIYSEPADNTQAARAREKYLKIAAGKKFLEKKILKDAGSLPD